MFDSNIGTVDKPTAKLMYLLGPISSDARLKLCLNPELSDYQMPQVNIGITMHELGLSLSKYQYHDFMLLLQALEYMTRASKFRKYKARHQLENLPNYQVKLILNPTVIREQVGCSSSLESFYLTVKNMPENYVILTESVLTCRCSNPDPLVLSKLFINIYI